VQHTVGEAGLDDLERAAVEGEDLRLLRLHLVGQLRWRDVGEVGARLRK